MPVHPKLATAWLAQLGDLESVKWEEKGSDPAWTINQGLSKTGKIMLGLICDFVSVQMITSLGGVIKPLDLYSSSYVINNLEGDVKKAKAPLAHLP